MADRSAKGPRRGDDRSHYDDSYRRDRPGRGGRDRDRDHGRDRDRDLGRDRDYRRYRSRSRDRRDRRRSRSPRHDRRDDQPRGDREDRATRRREEVRDLHKDRDDREERERENEMERKRSASPRRSASPAARRDSTEVAGALPTRSKPATPTVAAAPVSFKVKAPGQDRRDGTHGSEQQPRDGSHDSRDHHDEEHSRGRFDADPMEEDEEEDLVVEEEGLDAMQAMLGFGGFGTTKGQKVLGNNVGAARKEKKTEYRQYMNRVGGFNRPLSPSR